MAKVLVVEDDKLIGKGITDGLSAGGHTVEWVEDGEEGAARLRHYHYDVVILDWNVPKKNGVEVCKEFRAAGGITPVIMLTSRGDDSDKVHGLDAGADDYLTKPTSLVELFARIRAHLRRGTSVLRSELKLGDLTLDPASSKARRGGKEVELLGRELALLEFLMRHPNQLFSQSDLLNFVWSSESEATEEAVRQCVARLRKKLEVEGQPSPIATVKGLGYRIEPV